MIETGLTAEQSESFYSLFEQGRDYSLTERLSLIDEFAQNAESLGYPLSEEAYKQLTREQYDIHTKLHPSLKEHLEEQTTCKERAEIIASQYETTSQKIFRPSGGVLFYGSGDLHCPRRSLCIRRIPVESYVARTWARR